MADVRTTRIPDRPTADLVSNRTRFQLRLLLAILAVMLVIVVVRIVQGELELWQMAVALLIGTVIGIALGRINRVSWDQSTGGVVSQMDLLGVAMLVIYIGFALSRNRIVGTWVDDAHTVSAIGLALNAGTIAGRILYLLRGIRNAFRVAGLLPDR